jgi:O-antigen ligase
MQLSLPRLHPSLAWLLAALAAGLVLAALPLNASLAVVAGVAALVLAVWEPALGLGLAVLFGPLKALVEFSRTGLVPDVGDLFGALPAGVRQLLDTAPSDLGQLFLLLALAGWLARGLLRRQVALPRVPLVLPLAAFVLISLASLIGAPAPVEGLKEVLKWVEIGLVLYLVQSGAARGRAAWLVAALLLAGAVQAALGYWQYEVRGIGPSHFAILGGHYRAYGTFEQPNPFGGFLGLIWPLAAGLAATSLLAFWRTRRREHLALAAVFGGLAGLLLVGLYVSFSRGAWLGAAAAALAVAIALPRRRWLGLGLVAAGLVAFGGLLSAGLLPAGITERLADAGDFAVVSDVRGATITVDNFAVIERLAHWQAAVAMATDHPWLGVGLGNYGAAYPQYALLNWPNPLGHAHMIYLNLLAETGALGLAAYLVLWLSVFALTMRAAARTDGLARGLAVGLLGAWAHLSVHQIVDNLYVNNNHLLLAVLLGLLIVLVRPRQPSLDHSTP